MYHVHTGTGTVSHPFILVIQQESITWISLAIITITVQYHNILWSFHISFFAFLIWPSQVCMPPKFCAWIRIKFFIESPSVLSASKSFKVTAKWRLLIYLDQLKNKIFFLASHWTLGVWKATGLMLKYSTSWMG